MRSEVRGEGVRRAGLCGTIPRRFRHVTSPRCRPCHFCTRTRRGALRRSLQSTLDIGIAVILETPSQCASGSTMSLATPTLVPRPSVFPHLLPKASQPYPTPLPNRRVYAHLNARRDLQREMDDLSDEENEVEDIVSHLYSASACQSCQ
jgi:hypothetical protein